MSIIVKPLVTEKANAITEKKNNRFSFVVVKDASKDDIKKAIEDLYNVNVEKVNTLIAPAKRKSRYTKAGMINGSVPSYKKAIVTLAEGQTIDFYSNIQ
ncbi:MAG: 50S ribosomal protein L23 [Marinilabiliaceae bacterium]|nr:50S ribosomal protein L23 [Marinilabiliaceae bacterium]